VPGDDAFRFARLQGIDDFASGRVRRNDEPRRNRVARTGMMPTLIVDLANFARHESGTDQRDADLMPLPFDSQPFGKGANRELAHGIGCSTRK